MGLCYQRLDMPSHGRIIKDVMRHQSGEEEKRKKERKRDAEAGFEAWKLWDEAFDEGDIEPADFFDPEEFGYRRESKSFRR